MPAPGAACPACTLPIGDEGGVGEAVVVAGRYLLQRELGRGTAKEVWLAHDLTLDRPVALARVRGGGAAWERLRHEARLTARLGDHRHIVTVHDVFEDAGVPCLVARYMSGGSLADRLARGRLAPEEAARVAREVADALAHAHAHGIVHRDVKPDNVWLDADGAAALGDFGVALAEGLPDGDPAAPAGTPLYAAPEAGPMTPRSDLYALGATLYELLTGRPPFTGATAAEVRERHRNEAPAPPAGAPEPLTRLALELLSKDPAQRPAGAAEVRDALARLTPAAPGSAPSRLVGREAELARLRETLAGAWSGTARTVVVAGEAGIGKTALLDALSELAREEGGTAIWGRAEPGRVAYGPWRPVVRALTSGAPPADLRRLLGGAAEEASGGEEARLRLFDAVADLLAAAAAERPLLVVLDDLHWADASSLRLLAHVAATDQTARLLMVGSVREGELAASDPLGALLDQLAGDPRAERLELRGLDPGDVRRLFPPGAEPPEGAVEAIHARTGGNPFYIGEVVRLLAAEGRLGGDGASLPNVVPTRVREVVLRRLERLGPRTGEVLGAAAVVGRFSIAGLARAGGTPPAAVAEALEPALAAGLVVPEAEGRYAFAHAIVRDAVYDGLPTVRRARLHEAMLAALRTSRDAGADVAEAELAHHALAAARAGGDPQPAWETALAAAHEAEAALGHAEAAGHYAAALEALELGAQAPVEERHEALLGLADATFAAGDIEAARRRYAQAAAVARRAGAAEVLARAALGFSQVQPYGEADEEAVALLSEALAALPPGDHALRARATGVLAARLDPVSDQERREALIDEAVAMGRRIGDEATLLWLQAFAVLISWRPHRAALRAAAAGDVVRAAARQSDHATLLWAHVERIRDALEAGDVAAADAEIDRARPIARGTRRTYNRWFLLVVEAARAAFAGRLEEAERLTEEALSLNRTHGEDCEQEHTVQRLVLAKLRWRPQEVNAPLLREYASRYPGLPVWGAMLALLEWDLGQPDAALRSLDACARDDFSGVLRTPDWLAALACLGEAAAGAGTPAQVGRLYALLRPHEARNPVIDDVWAAWGPVARPLGLLAAADDRPAEAAGHFERAIALADAWGAPGWALRAIGDWLATGVAAPDRDALLGRGLALARTLGLPSVAAALQTTMP